MRETSAAPMPAYVPEALAASNVGTWSQDLATDRVQYDAVTASLFGLPPARGGEGLPLRRFVDAVHPTDRPMFHRELDLVSAQGGMIIFEFRTVPGQGEVRWAFVRGRYETDRAGRVVRGRGIVIDITDCKRDGQAEGEAFFLGVPDEGSPLDRAADHALAMRVALQDAGPHAWSRLRPLADGLLLEIGRLLAAALVRQSNAGEEPPRPSLGRKTSGH